MGEFHNIIALLRWQAEIGADETIGDEPVDWMSPSEAPRPPIAAAARPEVRAAPPAPILGAVAATANAQALANAATTLAELKDALESFDGLTLKQTATNLVFGRGNPNAKVMLLGEAPGAEEDRQGLPFVGASGRLLDRMLGAIGLTDSQFYISNVLTWRPPGNRKPTPAEIAVCLPFAERHIALVRPRLLILLGDTAAKAMLGGNEGITRTRGRWFHLANTWIDEGIPALATFHPAYLLRTPASKRESWRDLLMLKAKLSELDDAKNG